MFQRTRPAAAIIASLFLLLGIASSYRAAGSAAHPAYPSRIVSIIPSATEMLFAIGLGNRVVADTANCDYPPDAMKKPHVGNMNIDIEAVVAERPDLVVGDSVWNARDVARLRQLGVNVYAPHPTSIADVEQELAALGRMTGNTRQAALAVREMRAKVRQAARIAAGNKRRPRVLCLVGYDPLYVAGPDTFVGQMITLAGGANVVATPGFPAYSREAAIAAAPQVLFCNPDDARRIEQDPAWRVVPAVRGKHVYSVGNDLLDRPGPRLADGLVQVARLIHTCAQ